MNVKTLQQAVTDWWLTNARIRHGHPPANETVVAPATASTAKQAPPAVAQVVPAAESLASKIASYAVPAAGLLSAGALGHAIYEGAKAPVPQPVQPAAVSQDVSLYQHLEDNGFHLPE